jgi:uncharacterized protein with NAD-binding domain and iron-sulfur cluster/tetratricopeptide (TPR) repeat protein
VAVLGGGAGALSTALALTDPALGGRYAVTVYTLGWRLGGKGASGRNAAAGQRIEEHGIHVWFGFYDNAFRLLDRCYRELADAGWRTPAGDPVSVRRCIGETPGDGAAFHPHESFVVNEQQKSPQDPQAPQNADGGSWSMWRLDVPTNDLVPGDGKPVPPETSLAFTKLAEMLAAITEIRAERARQGLESLPPAPPPPTPESPEEQAFRGYAQGRVKPINGNESAVTLTPEDHLQNALDGLAAPALDDALATRVEEGLFDEASRFRLRLRFVSWTLRCARNLLRAWAGLSAKTHRLYLACDTFAAIATGLSKSVFNGDRDPEQNMRALDDVELRDWLATHGADRDYLLANPTVRFIYNSAFAFVDGKHELPRIAAGPALRGVLRLFLTYKGAFAYRMAAGMGDLVFSPIYEVLRRRGVEVKFFHRVDGLGLADAGGRPVVDEIRLTEQARPAAGADHYDPFVWVKDFPCWPNVPNFEQLENGAELDKAVRTGGLNLEDPAARAPGEKQRALRRGQDFDEVVLGIPVEALKPIAGDLVAHPKLGPAWRAMLANTATTPTQAFQIWFRATLRDLGWNDPPAVFGTYVEPIDTYIDMTPALALEERRHDDVKNLSYFCGVFDRRAGETHAEAMARAEANAIEHLVERASYIWPALKKGPSFEWRMCWNGGRGDDPTASFRAGQYARANVLPSELYTLNLPGTSRYRLAPDAAARPEQNAAPANLWLAGDWTSNPINLGCVEATVMSGLAAARGLSRAAIEIIGERDQYLWQSIGNGKRLLSTYEGVDSGAEPDGAAAGPAADAARAPTPAVPDGAAIWNDGSLDRLERAVTAFDRAGVEELCAALERRLASDGPPLGPDVAIRVLNTLRRKRHFDLMRQVGDAFLDAGADTPKVRRLYAQALIDLGALAAALAVLRHVAADDNPDLDERAEALGLLGRTHKQRFVNAPHAPRAADSLRAAIDCYNRGYLLGRANQGWHAVNAVALIARARHDGVALGSPLDRIDAGALARAALDRIGEKAVKNLDAWDYAIAAEANLGLGDHDEAIACCKEWVARAKHADAFEMASSLRQYEEVWQLTADVEPGAAIVPMIQGELLVRQGGRLDLPASQIHSARSSLQKILGAERAVTVQWYRTGLERCRLVARITDPFERGGGTGFLVRAGDLLACDFPDELVLLTNAHVLEPEPREEGTLGLHQALVRFEAARPPPEPPPVHRVREIVWSDPALDATVARLDPAPSGLAGCPLAAPEPALKRGNRVYVIGHPQGGALSLSLYDNLLLDRDQTLLHYRAPTEPGSSGSPVFDGAWNIVGLHHAGGLAMRRLNGQPGVYAANEGIWIEAIRRAAVVSSRSART